MKRIFFLFLAVMIVASLTGCVGAYYGSQAQYEGKDNDWYFLADSREVARIKQDKLAFDKLASQPVQAATISGVPQGFLGVVVNFSRYERYNFELRGPEKKNYLLGPGERAVDYLLPGRYRCATYKGGSKTGETVFDVGPQTQVFMNEKYHWYVYAEW